MNKEIVIEGMMCNHCTSHVQKALSGVPGVTAVQVDLDKKTAFVDAEGADENALRAAVADAGYEVVEIR